MSPSQPIRSLAAIVFTDIVGYSAHVNRDDANAMRMVEEHFALVREIAGRFGGKVIKTIGDSVHLELASAQAATACSIAIQQAHRERNTRVAEPQRFEVRIGAHLGDVEHRGGDIYGDGVNIAARLQPLAPVGGIAISDSVRNQLPLDLRNRFVSRGTPTLKNIDTPIELFVLEGDALAGIAVDVPPPEAAVAAAAAKPAQPSAQRRTPIIVAAGIVVALLAVAVALAPRWLSKGHADIPDKSIAVLPFVNLSSDKEQEYFSDGIAEDLLNLLNKVETLKVAARTSSFSFKGKDVAIQDIAVALRVAHVLEGSVRKAGNQVRITAQLVRAADGYQIWSQSWDRQMDDVFKIQDEIARAVVDQLKVQLLGQAPTAKPVDPSVYPLILQADALLAQFSPDSMKRSVEVYEQALAIAPNEARAWAGLGRALVNLTLSTHEQAGTERRIDEASNKALELDPTNVIAMMSLGTVAWDLRFDLPTAVRYIERARELEPANPVVLNRLGTVLMFIGRMKDAQAVHQFRAARDPANPGVQNNLANSYFYAREWDRARDAYRTALRLNPDIGNAHWQLGAIHLLGKNDPASALKEFALDGDESNRLAGAALTLHALGRHGESDASLQALIGKFGAEQPMFVASVYAYRGNRDAAFEWLDKAVAVRDPFMSYILVDPLLDSLRDDPRWGPLLHKVGYAPEQLAKIQLNATLPQSTGP